jgi:DNA-binding transcriptional ArsR family regulator
MVKRGRPLCNLYSVTKGQQAICELAGAMRDRIDQATGIGQPALSQQLAELRRAELVQSRRSAKQVYYRLANDDVSVCVRSIEAILGRGRDAFAAVSAVVAENPKRWPKELGSAGAAAFAKII